jgi:anti-sigma regulatory factor (Ser/Thr protein kinase)
MFPAASQHVREARDFVDEAAAAAGFDEDARFDIKLAATEAVANAILHGSRSPEGHRAGERHRG